MKTILSAIVALSFLAGVVTPASAPRSVKRFAKATGPSFDADPHRPPVAVLTAMTLPGPGER